MSIAFLKKAAASVANSPADHKTAFIDDTGIPKLKDEAGVVTAWTAVLADGDYGDVTVSGTGTAIAIDAGAVTTTKMGGDVTAIGKSLLTAADAAAERVVLGLVIGTNVQAFDAELAAIAGLTSAADKLPYFTGSGTAALADLTAAARTVLDDASTAAMLTTLGAQPVDATLTALAGANWAQNALPIGTGADTLAQTSFAANTFPARASTGDLVAKTITDFGLSLVDDANAAAALVTIGAQPLDSDLTTIAGLTATTDNFMQAASSAWASRTPAQAVVSLQGSGLDVDAAGFRGIPQNSQSANYTTVAADAGKHLLHPSGGGAADTFTIDSNANVAYEIGTAITFINMDSNVVSIAITSDTMYLAQTGATGTRTLAQYGVATAVKTGSTEWIISGAGIT